jgi:enamine deaminase RidA (YjgF/YER057c/UK114 family)
VSERTARITRIGAVAGYVVAVSGLARPDMRMEVDVIARRGR